MSSQSDSHAPDADRLAQARELINDCLRRRAAGEVISEKSLLNDNPHLLPELADELCNLNSGEETYYAEQPTRPLEPAGLRIRCPHCLNPVVVVDDSSLSDVLCPACGSQFSLVDDDHSYRASREQDFGHFQLLDKLGAGAFGSVWSATDTKLDRKVALKIPRKGQLSATDTELFIREARAAAQLKHPNIVSVLEVGRHEDRIYIVSELVGGLNLADWLTGQRATPREAAELTEKIADALQHAHERGIIHRDLKPSNIMLDVKGEPHLMDFGLAKRDHGEATMTVDGKLLGTPAYMPPEQARGEAHQADARSDVYSLGVILFEILTGERPFRGSVRMLLQQVLLEEAPSTRSLNNNVPKDLDTICLKCLEKDPDRRYQTASALRDDLRSFRLGEPVSARPITRFARGWRWCRKHPAIVTAAGSAVVAALSLVVLGVGYVYTAQLERARGLTARGLYDSQMHEVQGAWEDGSVQLVSQLLDRQIPQPGADDFRGFEWFYYDQLRLQSESVMRLPHPDIVTSVKFSTDSKWLATTSDDGIVRIWDRKTGQPLRALPKVHSRSVGLVFTADNSRLFSIGADGEIVMWDLGSFEYTKLPGETSNAYGVICSEDGRYLAAEGEDHSVLIWNVENFGQSGRRDGPVAYPEKTAPMAFIPGGSHVVSTSRLGKLQIWDRTSGELVHEFDSQPSGSSALTVSDDGRQLATGSRDGIQVWDLSSRRLIAQAAGPRDGVTRLILSPQGNRLGAIGGSLDTEVMIWELTEQELKLRRPIGRHRGRVRDLVGVPQGNYLASLGESYNIIRLWDFDTGQPVTEYRGHTNMVYGLAAAPDGTYLASGGRDREARLWKIGDTTAASVLRDDTSVGTDWSRVVWSVVFSPDGSTVVTASQDSRIRLWDVNHGELLGYLEDERLGDNMAHETSASSLCFLPDQVGDTLISSGKDGDIKFWSLSSRSLERTFEDTHKGGANSLAVSPDGRTLISGGEDGKVIAWDLPAGKAKFSRVLVDAKVWPVAFSPRGDVFAAAGTDQQIHIWSADGTQRNELSGHTGSVTSVQFSPDGTLLLSASQDETVRIWDVARGEATQELIGHSGEVQYAVFAPDDKTLVSVSCDRTIRMWDSVTGASKGVFKGHAKEVQMVAFSPDGTVMATACWDGTVRLWRAPGMNNRNGDMPDRQL